MREEDFPSIELSPDIEWLMLNSQRGDSDRMIALLTILVEQVGKAALWTSMEMIVGPLTQGVDNRTIEMARRVSMDGLMRMVTQGQRYRPGIDLTAWACQAVLEEVWERRRAWRMEKTVPQPQPDENLRLECRFRDMLNLSPHTIIEILGLPPSQPSREILVSAYPWDQTEMEALLKLASEIMPETSDDSAILSTRQITPTSFGELAIVLSAIAGVALIMWVLNIFNPVPGVALRLPAIATIPRIPTPSPDWEATAVAKNLIPLNEDSTVDQILERLGLSFGLAETIWQDSFITYFGPQGFNGQPVAWRVALWMQSETGWLLASVGPADKPPYYVYRFNNSFEVGIVRGQLNSPGAAVLTGFVPIENTPPYPGDEIGLVEPVPIDMFYGLEEVVVNLYGFNLPMDSDETNVKLPMRTIADRDAVGIATLDSSGNVIREYYFDAVYGWMLLMNQYSQSNPGVLLQRVQIEHILFNVPFSSIWDNPTFPLLIGYQPEPVSKDHQSPVEAPEWIGWPPEEIELISPGYNLANAALSFQSTMGYSQINTFDRRLQITAGSHLVGNLRTSYYGPQILSITCRRSPDGQKLAFEGTFGDQRIFSGTAVTWLDLFSLAESQREILDLQLPDQYSDRFHILILPVDPVEKALPEEDYYSGNAISDLTFSPDGNRLAVVTARWQLVGPNNTVYYRQGGIYIADLSAGEVLSDTQAMPPIPAAQLLESVVDGRSLVWSPDGSQLALIVVVNNSNRQSGSSATTVEEIWVLDTASGAVVFREPLDLLNGRPIGDWPMLTWGVDFPVDVVKGLEGCASVPVR